jgi:uncharacterized FAD-dependent dehydrogenase
MIVLNNIKIFKDLTEDEVISSAINKNKINKEDIIECNIVKKSIDARDKRNICYNYSLNIKLKDENKYPNLKHIEELIEEPIIKNRTSTYNPIIVGAGPAGLFCALTLIDNGYKPIIIEQGDKVENRIKIVDEYRTNGKLNPLCNVQFGEGGAGTFSDGKLTTGINSIYIKKVLDYFYKFGAPKEILYLNNLISEQII